MTDTIFKPGEYVTRDGHKARVYATDGAGIFPIHGATKGGEDLWHVQKWRDDGGYCDKGTHSFDLMPPKQVRYVNVYRDGVMDICCVYRARCVADNHAVPDRIACIRIEFTEGQYDD